MDVKRHICILCKRKKTAIKMIKTRSHWTCLTCLDSGDQRPELRPDQVQAIKVLNLYAGIGGNRKLWPDSVHITAVEKDLKVAAAYRDLYPNDRLIIGDAHNYLLKHYNEFNIIWSSPPCQSHSRMNYWTPAHKKRYIDISLYQEIIFLQNFFKGKWIVENVNPYYAPLIKPDKKIDRHIFWSNVKLSDHDIKNITGFIKLHSIEDKETIMQWLGIRYEKNIYLTGKNYLQVFRNCVHPEVGLSLFKDIITALNTQQ